MFRKVLIANRGEIALRVIRACRELGIETVAIYSEADQDSLHVHYADEDVCVGSPPSAESYLNIPRILAAAEVSGVDAIHPGYGFLAENPRFAEMVESNGIRFIGPSAEVIRRMGNKAAARRTMIEAGVPVVPGSEGLVQSDTEAVRIAREIGYPVMVKASAGGGGKGMRIARDDASLAEGLRMARNEAESAFGDSSVYLEKLIVSAKHIEFQIIADSHGNVVHLGERDCSIQRRHQKLIEESPCPVLDERTRGAMGEAAVRGARGVGYEGAGTIEFLYDRTNGQYYFMEMNTRIQVEHPVTEEVTGIDLVRTQIAAAAGEPLPFKQEEVRFRGHSIECRVNAEDPEKGFIPSAGTLETFHPPGGPGVRVDSHAHSGYVVPPHYDSLLAKLIVKDDTREAAIVRMRRALGEFVVEGVRTTIPFHLRLLEHSRFLAGDTDTRFAEELDAGEEGKRVSRAS
ncbi:MAG: acetyl-CoA carboxylase biotin carboxylase subunit [Candidatus Eisenbacteria bacterium]|nr:acetyl-CoA carboxylase biotin carboxylase subunit [Candidatus Eisenbacteria bacterium]